jgi:hypothetical protein
MTKDGRKDMMKMKFKAKHDNKIILFGIGLFEMLRRNAKA